MSDRPFAYVCSPYRGDTEANAEKARGYCREVFEAGYSPLAPHLFFPQFLNDNIPKEREAGMEMAAALLPQCRVLVVCGDDITEGMASEIRLAQELGIECCALENILIIPSVQHIFSAFIANAEDYENGELVGTWLPFPTTREAFQETLAAIGVDGPEHPGWLVEKYQSSLESICLLPWDSDVDELNYLAVKLERLNDPYKELFDLAMLTGEHENTTRFAINIIENIDCFGLQAIYSPEQYGKLLIEIEQREFHNIAGSIGILDTDGSNKLITYIDYLEKSIDYTQYGSERAKKEGGIFTAKGYLTLDHDMRELFHGLENVPDEYRIVGPVSLLQIRTEDALDFDKQIEPFYLVEHGGDNVSVCLYVSEFGGSAYKEEVFTARRNEGFYGSGYDWTLLALAFMEEKLPELQGVVNFDPERGLFCAYSDDRAALERFTLAFKDTCENDAVICDLFSRVDKNLYLKAYEHEDPQTASRETNEKPSVLEQIAASRAERGATSKNPDADKPKSRDPEL